MFYLVLSPTQIFLQKVLFFIKQYKICACNTKAYSEFSQFYDILNSFVLKFFFPTDFWNLKSKNQLFKIKHLFDKPLSFWFSEHIYRVLVMLIYNKNCSRDNRGQLCEITQYYFNTQKFST